MAAILLVAGGLAAPLWVALHGRIPELSRPSPAGLRAGLAGIVLANWGYLFFRGV
jgi:hypothetical protein